MRVAETNTVEDDSTLALRALAWTLGAPERAARLIDVTGITPDGLRARAAEPSVQSAALAFLEAHEPDLVACAGDLGVPPARLVAARERLA